MQRINPPSKALPFVHSGAKLASRKPWAASGFLIVVIGLACTPPAGAQDAHKDLSSDEVARQLANPNNSLASLTFKNQYRWYDGSLPGAASQDNYTMLFQPVFPFTLPETASGGKANLFVRPAFPLVFEQPAPDPATGIWDGVTGLGAIGYGVTEPNGFLCCGRWEWSAPFPPPPTACSAEVSSASVPRRSSASSRTGELRPLFQPPVGRRGLGRELVQHPAGPAVPEFPPVRRMDDRKHAHHQLRLAVRPVDCTAQPDRRKDLQGR